MIPYQPASQGARNQPRLIAYALLFTLLIFSGFFGFLVFVWKQNIPAASSCLMLELVSVLYFQFKTAVVKGTLQQKYTHTRLKVVFIAAVLVGVSEFVGAVCYAVLGYLNEQDFQVEGRSYYIAIIPAAAGALVSPFLAYESRLAMGEFVDGPTGMVHFPA